MIDYHTLFTITYGMYIIGAGDRDHGNGFISNTVFQLTSEPPRFAASCNKDNYTGSLIEKHQHFSVSVLHQKAQTDILGTFGFKSGRDLNKLEGRNVKYGISGSPIILDDSIAYLECQVVEKIDMGTHWLFIGDLIDAQLLNSTEEAMSYAYYHQIKKGKAPKNAPTFIAKEKLVQTKETGDKAIYECSVCGDIYDNNQEDILFEDLPEDWTCPVCGAEKENFIKINN